MSQKKTKKNPTGRPAAFTDKQIIAALKAAGGLQAEACRVLYREYGRTITRSAMSSLIARRPNLQKALAEIEEATLDFAEAQLMAQLEAGMPSAIAFYLKTKGRHRGYTTRLEVTGRNGGPVEVENFDVDKLSLEEARQLRELLARGAVADD